MRTLQVTLLLIVPVCFGQFSIQGPSDGNRKAQGLRYSQEKGLEYSDIKESLGAGDFSIQGASDGSTDFNIQGATDGNSQFHIQGATDGGSQAYIQGAYDAMHQQLIQQPASAGGVNYNDPSVNWRSFNRGNVKTENQVEDDGQYREAPKARPVTSRRPSHRRPQVHTQPKPQPEPRYQQYQEPPPANINYNPIDKAPQLIQEILQFQAQIPYENEHLRFDALETANAQAKRFQEEYPKQVLAQRTAPVLIEEHPRNQYRQSTQRESANRRQKRQAQDTPQPLYHRGPPRVQPVVSHPYKRLAAQYAAGEPTLQYSPHIPIQIRELLKFQAQLPYQLIANNAKYAPAKQYVAAETSSPHNVYQQHAGYQSQPAYYQGQTYTQSEETVPGQVLHHGNHEGYVSQYKPVNEHQQ